MGHQRKLGWYGKNWIFGPKTEILGQKKGGHFCTLTMFLNQNPHSLTLVTPNPTSSPSTQLFLDYNTYEYPHREEEKDSRMAGFKLGVFYREAHLIGPQESGCSTIGRSQKAVWILAQVGCP